MKKTLLCHFYNEEYLLPWWLKHHREMFDHGIMVNYASSDSSVNIIRELCPSWDIVDSVNSEFDATTIEPEMNQYERLHPGWKMILNITEFLVGDMSLLESPDAPDCYIARCHIMVDSLETQNKEPDPNRSLLSTRTNGINTLEPSGKKFRGVRNCRLIHRNEYFRYSLGRHYTRETTNQLHVLWYGFSPFTQGLLKRKLQIKDRIPEHNKVRGMGAEHLYTEEKMISEMKRFQDSSKDIAHLISMYGDFK